MAKEVTLYNKIDRISNAGQIGHKLLTSNKKMALRLRWPLLSTGSAAEAADDVFLKCRLAASQ
jgi:hypothetical protein